MALGVGQPLDEQQADALRPAGAVRGGGEGLAATVGRHAALAGEVDERAGRRHDRDTAHQRHVALAAAQRLGRDVQCHQRGGARGVDRDGRALQPEGVGHAAGGDAAGVAGAQVAGHLLRDRGQPVDVVVVHQAGEHTGPAAAQGGRVDARAFERLVGDLQQQPLLRVHRDGLAGRDAEERRVELAGVVQEPALAGVHRLAQQVEVPAAVGRERRDGVHAVGHDPPEVLRRGDAAGEPAGHRHDRQRLVGALGGARLDGRGGQVAEQLAA